MPEVKNKRILTEIAKRYAKGLLMNISGTAFDESGLDEDEMGFIADVIEKIGNKITEKDSPQSATELVAEYFTFE